MDLIGGRLLRPGWVAAPQLAGLLLADSFVVDGPLVAPWGGAAYPWSAYSGAATPDGGGDPAGTEDRIFVQRFPGKGRALVGGGVVSTNSYDQQWRVVVGEVEVQGGQQTFDTDARHYETIRVRGELVHSWESEPFTSTATYVKVWLEPGRLRVWHYFADSASFAPRVDLAGSFSTVPRLGMGFYNLGSPSGGMRCGFVYAATGNVITLEGAPAGAVLEHGSPGGVHHVTGTVGADGRVVLDLGHRLPQDCPLLLRDSGGVQLRSWPENTIGGGEVLRYA